MKGLLIKEFYTLLKYFRSYLLISALFLGISLLSSENMFFVFYPSLLCGMIPINLLAYDERSKWDVYSLTLPCSRAQLVSSKYLMGLFSQIFVIAAVGITQYVQMRMAGTYDSGALAVILGSLVILSCVPPAISCPMIFKLGVEKGRMWYYVMIGVVCGGSVFASSLLKGNLDAPVSFTLAFPLMVVLAVGIYAGSWLLSIHFYRSREL